MSDPPSVRSEVASAKTSEAVDSARVLDPASSHSLPLARDMEHPSSGMRKPDERVSSESLLFYEKAASSLKEQRTAATPESGTETETPILSNRSRDVLHLIEEVIGHVNKKTQRRVHDLCIKIIHDKIILEGTCQTFHTKQLAQQAAMNNERSLDVENRITVKDEKSRS